MITGKLIQNRIDNFLGYGNIDSDIWFIGKEEGFHGDIKELEIRFINTKDRSVVDIQDDMVNVKDHMKHFMDDSKIQKTWHKLINILLVLDSELNINNDKILQFQREKFARLKSNHCNLLFLPLPCRSDSQKDWFYDQFEIDYLSTRKIYEKEIMPLRVKLFRELINKHKPRTVIFYTTKESYLEKWKDIVDHDFMKISDYIYHCKKNRANFFVIPSPTALGKLCLTKEEWFEVAHRIKEITGL